MSSAKHPRVVRKKVSYSSPWFTVMAKEVVYPWKTGSETYFSVKSLEYCSALALTKEGYVILVKQFRPVLEQYTYELPSGCVEKGETPRMAMERELKEETGFSSNGRMQFLAQLHPDSGRLENMLWCYFAPKALPNSLAGRNVEPGIETVLCSPRELKKLITSGKFNHAPHMGIVALAVMKGKLAL